VVDERKRVLAVDSFNSQMYFPGITTKKETQTTTTNMPATIYSDIEGFSLKHIRNNRDGKTYSAYFENVGKVQLGNMDGQEEYEAMSVSDMMKGDGNVTGIRLEVLEPKVRKWIKELEIQLIFEAKKKFSTWFDGSFDTHEVQELYQSMFVSKHEIELRLSSNMNIYLMEDGKPVRIDVKYLRKDVLCIPIVQFVGVWMEESLKFGIVAKVTDVMCFEGEEEEVDEDGKHIFSRKAQEEEELTKASFNSPLRPDSPIESIFGGGTVVPTSVVGSLYQKKD